MMKEVKGLNKYKVNESGIVINKKGHPLRTALSNSGYLRTALEENDSNHRINKSIHRIVAETFIPNPDNLPVVMHIDNDTLNNHVSNLKWGTQAENIKQSFLEGRKVSPKSNSSYVYEVYNEDTGDIVKCKGRTGVSELIGYKEISLKNMVGNDRESSCGFYKGYKIRRTGEKIRKPIKFKK